MKIKKYLKILKIYIFGFILFLTVQLQAQEKNNGTLATLSGEYASKDTIKTFTTESDWLPATALYFELGGKFWYSLNLDFRRKENFALSFGIAYFEEDGNTNENNQSLFFPSIMAYYLSGERHRLELGSGLGAGIGTSQGLAAITLHGVVGYRYQKKKGLIFRAGFTPFISIPIAEGAKFMIVPWAGVSLGYSF